ncbi:MAG: hypothetical protein R2710_21555 [Acidimicrobiales bacterium]
MPCRWDIMTSVDTNERAPVAFRTPQGIEQIDAYLALIAERPELVEGRSRTADHHRSGPSDRLCRGHRRRRRHE